MKKVLVYIVATLVAGSSLANVGWFDDFLSVSVNDGADTQYAIDAWHGADLGSVSSLTLKTIDFDYWSDNQDRTGGSLWYQVYEEGNGTPVAAATEIIWSQSGPVGNDYNGAWSGSQDMLNGYSLIADKTYYVQVWAKSWGTSQGDSFLDNSGASTNYEATFTAVPEPATVGMLGLGALLTLVIRRIKIS